MLSFIIGDKIWCLQDVDQGRCGGDSVFIVFGDVPIVFWEFVDKAAPL